MKLKYQMLRLFTKRVLERNTQFKNRHAGETCYIVGNGPSLKNMELSVFSDHISIGLNLLCLHNDYRLLNIPYHVLAEPFFFYPYVKNPFIDRYQPNVLGRLFLQAMSRHPDIALFTSLSNIFGPRSNNTYYLYHFGHRQPDKSFFQMNTQFSCMAGSFYAGVGLAINMGFKKAILVGCDYLLSPSSIGHFYGVSSIISPGQDNIYADLLRECMGLIELQVITDGGISLLLPYQDYESFTGEKMRRRSNVDIVAPEYLKLLNRAVELKQYPMAIYPTSESAGAGST